MFSIYKKAKTQTLQKEIRSVFFALMITLFCMIILAEASYKVSAKAIDNLSASYYRIETQTMTEQVKVWLANEKATLESQVAKMEIDKNLDYDYLREYLTDYVNNYLDENAYDLYYTDYNNIIISGAGFDNLVERPDMDYRERNWFKDAVVTDDTVYSTAYRDTDTLEIVFSLSKRVKIDGEITGVMIVDIFVDTLFDMFSQVNLPGNSYAFLVDKDYGILNHTYEAFDYYDFPTPMKDVGVENYDRLQEALINGEDSISFTDYDGVNRTFYIEKLEESGWFVVSAVEDAIIANMAKKLRDNIVHIALWVMLLALILDGAYRIYSYDKTAERINAVNDLAYEDNLTRMGNERAYAASVDSFGLEDYTDDLMVISMDLNRLKWVNDHLGHAAGDEIIRGAAVILKEVFDKFGECYRVGGDEYTIVARMSDSELEESIKRVEELTASWNGELVDGISISYGVAKLKDYPERNVRELTAKADEAMYEQKERFYRELYSKQPMEEQLIDKNNF